MVDVAALVWLVMAALSLYATLDGRGERWDLFAWRLPHEDARPGVLVPRSVPVPYGGSRCDVLNLTWCVVDEVLEHELRVHVARWWERILLPRASRNTSAH